MSRRVSTSGAPRSNAIAPALELAPHPNVCDLEGLPTWAATLEGPLAIDLFSGAGGLSLGLEQAGFNVVLGVDKRQHAVATHRHHFGGASLVADLATSEAIQRVVEGLRPLELDLVAGGPPCQPFSRAGKSKIRSLLQQGIWEEDDRRELWQSFMAVVEELMPRAVLIENVPEMALGHDAEVVRALVDSLENLGYVVHARILSAWRYGVPQHRRRLFIVGITPGHHFEWPEPAEGPRPTVMDAISDLPKLAGGEGSVELPYGASLTPLQSLLREGMMDLVVFDHVARSVRDDDLEAYRLLDSDMRYDELPAELRRYRSDIFTDKYKRLPADGLSRTITAHIAKDGYWYIHPTQHRTLTVREAARIQTFPDTYRFSGSPTRAFQQIGEAVPPLLGKALGTAIGRALESDHSHRHYPAPLSTRNISARLQEWMKSRETHQLKAPWRSAASLWHVLIGMMVFERLPARIRRSAWKTFAGKLPTPRDWLNGGRGPVVLRSIGGGKFVPEVTELAEQIEELEKGTREEISLEGLTSNQVKRAMAMVGESHRLPQGAAAVRMAQRVWGDIDNRSSMSSQLAMARMVGPDPDGLALRGVLEVAETWCHKSDPECGHCPLNDLCSIGRDIETHELELSQVHPDPSPDLSQIPSGIMSLGHDAGSG